MPFQMSRCSSYLDEIHLHRKSYFNGGGADYRTLQTASGRKVIALRLKRHTIAQKQ